MHDEPFPCPDIDKNGHFGGDHDGSYESGFMTRC